MHCGLWWNRSTPLSTTLCESEEGLPKSVAGPPDTRPTSECAWSSRFPREVPGVQDVSVKHVQKKETLEFKQRMGRNESPWSLFAENMSDGTLRALGVLTALFQSVNGGAKHVPLVGIEEPEVAVHPGAAGVLRDALRTAAEATQVIVTSHSPDLLEDKDVGDESILGVANVTGETKIGSLNEAGRSAIRDRLYTAGELLRLNQLTPDITKIDATPSSQLELFGERVS